MIRLISRRPDARDTGDSRVSALLRSEKGNVVVTFALCLVPLMGIVGMAIDYGQAVMLRNRLQIAADAAALGVIAEESPASLAAGLMKSDGVVAVGAQDGLNLMAANLSAADRKNLKDASVTVQKTGGYLTSKVSFAGASPNSILQIFGRNDFALGGAATGQHLLAQYVDFYILIDNTPSMGVAATPADMARMEKKNDGCAFACHDLSNSNGAYQIAKKNGIKMRIDTVRLATQELTETASESAELPEQFRMGVYTFGTSAEDLTVTTITAPTPDLTKVRNSANAVDLMTIPYQGYNNDQMTDFVGTLKQMNDLLTKSGDGSIKDDPQKILFLVSDGVNDGYLTKGCTKPLTGTRCQAPIDVAQSYCQKIKDKNIKVAVLYTTYSPLPSNGWYNTWISPFQAEIGTKMQACASAGLYYEVSPSEGIDDAMKALFQKALRTVQLAS
ncbi:MAG: pilus assembly protein [Methylobacterium mesophilicum]|nr:pilus assembly protein [Methylobacterium mesophilicum]